MAHLRAIVQPKRPISGGGDTLELAEREGAAAVIEGHVRGKGVEFEGAIGRHAAQA